jgi:hypothetical protein
MSQVDQRWQIHVVAKTAAAESGWFWWLSYLSPFAWLYLLREPLLFATSAQL